MKKFIIITTINKKTNAVEKFSKKDDWSIVIVGDRKSYNLKSEGNIIFISIEDQKKMGYQIVEKTPYNHYARKNIGYLYAIKCGADIIYDTDDDNFPYDNWKIEDFSCNRKIDTRTKFFNIYQYFTKKRVWPRGFPLNEILSQCDYLADKTKPVNVGVWQGLVDIEPDVDAIYRLTVNRQLKFENKPSVYLEEGVYCPFNSQNTFWRKELFPLLYLPSTISFRFTDILRGYIAQRLMWEEDLHLGFTKATVYQNRNIHDFMNDFKQEIECYINVNNLIDILEIIELGNDMIENLYKIYSELVKRKIVNKEEMEILRLWINEVGDSL